MRILFITRIHPHRELGGLEARLHDRLRELSELGHEVLVLTRWSGTSIDFELPQRIEVRFPFKSFLSWEWTRALPMIFAWRPDLLHVFDPGLGALERAVSVELMAITMLDTLRKASRGRSSYQGGLVSLTHASARGGHENGWKKAGAEAVEWEWLSSPTPARTVSPWDFATNRRLRIGLAGRVGKDLPFQLLLDAIFALRKIEDVELTALLNRASLSASERRELARTERLQAFGAGIGSRLHLVPSEDAFDKISFDAGLVIGLERGAAAAWIERLPTPLVFTESLLELEARASVLGLVTDVAPFPRALQLATDRTCLAKVWSQIEQGSLSSGRDMAANQVSRIYSQIAGSALNS